MKKKSQHVVPNSKGGWSVRKKGAKKASKSFVTEKAASAYARSIAKKEKSELYVHRKDGTIRSKECYKSDPGSPVDKK